MAALVALLMKSRRTALDMAVYQRRISSVKRMFEPENSLMNFMLPFSLANLAQDRKTRSRDEIRNKKSLPLYCGSYITSAKTSVS